jgi:hypothetical protein
MPHAESHYTPIRLERRKENRFVEICGGGISGSLSNKFMETKISNGIYVVG